MEDRDVNPLIDSNKSYPRLLEDCQGKVVKFCNKYRSEIFFGTSILVVILCLGVILSILFNGGKTFLISRHKYMIREKDKIFSPAFEYAFVLFVIGYWIRLGQGFLLLLFSNFWICTYLECGKDV